MESHGLRGLLERRTFWFDAIPHLLPRSGPNGIHELCEAQEVHPRRPTKDTITEQLSRFSFTEPGFTPEDPLFEAALLGLHIPDAAAFGAFLLPLPIQNDPPAQGRTHLSLREALSFRQAGLCLAGVADLLWLLPQLEGWLPKKASLTIHANLREPRLGTDPPEILTNPRFAFRRSPLPGNAPGGHAPKRWHVSTISDAVLDLVVPGPIHVLALTYKRPFLL